MSPKGSPSSVDPMAKRTPPHPHVAGALAYAEAVASGELPACLYVRQACERQLRDLSRAKWRFCFDSEAAERICRFAELLPHIKGPKAGERIRLAPWQTFVLTTAFGWVNVHSGGRRFRRVYIEVPRGNGKTTMSDAPALYMLAADSEGGAEVYSAARTRDQAKIAFWTAQQMARRSPDFLKSLGVEVLAHRIVQARSASYYEAVSADADSLEGKNVHFGLIDEFHAHRSRDVYDAIETGAGKRHQSMLWAITTAGSDKTGVCYEQRAYLINILKSTVTDENYFGIIYTIDDGDDWTAEETWRKANPNYGISVEPEHIALQCRKAVQSPASQASFLTKHLNVWIQTDQALFDMRAWSRCADPRLVLALFEGKPCTIAVDLASKTDMAAMVLLFERDGVLIPFGRFYLPEAAVDETRNASYRGWALQKRLTLTPGDVIDFGQIEADLLEFSQRFQVREIAYDPWQATQLATRLAQQGAKIVEFRQTVANFSEPTKELDALMRAGKIAHDGDPVLAWMIGNVVGHYDAKENVYPRKERHENKIDGAIALIMAVGRHMVVKPPLDIDEWLKNPIFV
ncbi:MAG: terminase TerL endonuclease subunit [Bradyrhizobium sp.]